MIQRSPAELAGAVERISAMGLPPEVAQSAEAQLQQLQQAAISVQCGNPIGLLIDAKRRATSYATTLQAPASTQLAEAFKDQAASFRRRLGR